MMGQGSTRGTKLLEATIAIFLFAIGLLGLAVLHLAAWRSDSFGHQATLATNLAKDKLAELQKGGKVCEGADRYLDREEGVTYERQWSVRGDMEQSESEQVIEVEVSWNVGIAERVVKVRGTTGEEGA